MDVRSLPFATFCPAASECEDHAIAKVVTCNRRRRSRRSAITIMRNIFHGEDRCGGAQQYLRCCNASGGCQAVLLWQKNGDASWFSPNGPIDGVALRALASRHDPLEIVREDNP